ncbi:vascular cell adhesion protein 1-like isoform X2 [Gouania willdenowi]|nr:vascular cell adhesion protein 1-like isoform X2 [Gouania willdenowi]
MEGNPVNLNCCCTGEFERVKLEWKKNQTLLKKGTFQSNSGCLILAFPKIKHEDSGRYVCIARVEIPLLIVDEGNGTTINVMSRDSMDNMDDSTREGGPQGVSSGELNVIQSPDVSVMEGNPVNLNCCFTGPFEIVKLEWKKNQTLLKKGTFHSNSGCLILAFLKMKHEDSGRYVCIARTEIPLLNVAEGNGTTINVMTRDSTDNMDNSTREEETPVIVAYVLRSLVILILITAFIYCYYSTTKAQRQKQGTRENETTTEKQTEDEL